MRINPLLQVLEKEPPDRVPVLIPTGSIAIKYSGESPQNIRSDGKKLASAQIGFQKKIDADAVSVYYDANYIPEAFGCQIKFTRFGPVIQKTLSINDELSLPDFNETESVKVILDAIQYASEQSSKPVMALFEGPFTTATRIFEAESLLVAMYRDPDTIKKALEMILQTLINFTDRVVESGADLLYIPDPSSTPDMISPQHAKRFSFPYLRKLVQHTRKHIPVIIHMCGDTRKIWRYMPDLMGSAYSLDQKISLREARSVMKEVIIGGNINPIDTLMFGSPEKVKKESIRAIQEGGPDNFVLMPGCGVPSESPLENLKVMVAVAKSWRL